MVDLHQWQYRLSKPQAYSLAVGIFAIALGLRLSLFPIEAGLAFLTFYPAMVLTFAICGIGPGFLLSILSAISGYFIFFPPSFSFDFHIAGNMAVTMFLLSAYLIAKFIGQQRETALYLRELIHNAPAGMIAINPKTGTFIGANPVVLKLFGYSEKEMLSKTIADLTPADEWEVSCKRNESLFKGEVDSLHFEKQYLRKDGSTFWAEVYASTLKDDNAKVRMFIGNMTDITERKHIQAALEISEQRYKAVLEDQTELICRFKLDGTILYVNAAYCRFFGIEQDAVVGTRWQPVVHQDDLPGVLQQLSKLNSEHRVVTIENRVLAAGRSIRWVQFVNRAFYDDHGHLYEYQSVGRDITERKDAEAKAKQHYDLLI